MRQSCSSHGGGDVVHQRADPNDAANHPATSPMSATGLGCAETAQIGVRANATLPHVGQAGGLAQKVGPTRRYLDPKLPLHFVKHLPVARATGPFEKRLKARVFAGLKHKKPPEF